MIDANGSCCDGHTCEAPADPEAPAATVSGCPRCGESGPSVSATTVAALTAGVLLPQQSFRACRNQGCEVVYHGTAGARVLVRELGVELGFKSETGSALVCYCFLHRRDDLRARGGQRDGASLVASVTEHVRQGHCACDVRNPLGRCCLGDLHREVAAARAETNEESR